MSYKFATVNALMARMLQQQTAASARSAFNEGLVASSIWKAVQSFPVTDIGESDYQIMQREDEILTTIPEAVSCGADIPVVGGNYVNDPVYYTPFKRRVALQLCKSKCGPQDFAIKHNQAEKETGAAFGKMYETVFWRGDGVNKPGITRTTGVEVSNLSATAYADLDTKSAIEIANMISMLTWGMADPVIYHGPILAELIGWRSQSTTGDTCGDVWACTLKLLAERYSESVEATRSRFKLLAQFDHMTGLDVNAPTEAHAAMLVVDRAFVRMGVGDIEFGSTWNQGADIANSERCMHMTTPQIIKMGAARFAFGFVDHAKILTAEGGRYADAGMPQIVVPTPLV